MLIRKGQFRVGTAGYQYDHWRGLFYPDELSKQHWFAHYALHFDTVEINNTFYGLPAAETFDAWRTQAPAGFCYVLKFSRYGSHVKRLKEPKLMSGEFSSIVTTFYARHYAHRSTPRSADPARRTDLVNSSRGRTPFLAIR